MGRRTGETNDEAYFQDTGCDVSKSCLTCPLEQCKHDDPIEYRRLIDRKNDAAMLEALKTMSVKQVAEKFGVITRTVTRVAARQ